LLTESAVGAQSSDPSSTRGSIQWKGEREETGEEGDYHYMFITNPLPPLACPSKILCQTKSGKMYKIMKLVAGGGRGRG